MGGHTSHEQDAILAVLSLGCLAALLGVFFAWLCRRDLDSEWEPLLVQTPPPRPPYSFHPSSVWGPPTPPTPDSVLEGRRSSRPSRRPNDPGYYVPEPLEPQSYITAEPRPVPPMPALASRPAAALIPPPSPPHIDPALSTDSSVLSAPGVLEPRRFSLFDWNHFPVLRRQSAPPDLARHEHTIFVAESPEQYDRDPWIARISPLLLPPQLIADDSPPLTPDLGRRPVSPPRRAQAVEPPYFEPNGRPSAYHDPPGYWFWPYEPNSYEREIYWEVYFRLLDELGDSPELPAVWPDGQRPLAPHWRPNGADQRQSVFFPDWGYVPPGPPPSPPTIPERSLEMMLAYDDYLKSRRLDLLGGRRVRRASWSSVEVSSVEVVQLGHGRAKVPHQFQNASGVMVDIDAHAWERACRFKADSCVCRPGAAERREGRMGICFHCARFFVDPAIKRLGKPPVQVSLEHLKIDPCTPQLASLMTDWAAFILKRTKPPRTPPPPPEPKPATNVGHFQVLRDNPDERGFRGSVWFHPSKRAAQPRRAYSLRDPVNPPRPPGTQSYRWIKWEGRWQPVHWNGTASAPDLPRDDAQDAARHINPLSITRAWARNAFPPMSERIRLTLDGRTSVVMRKAHA